MTRTSLLIISSVIFVFFVIALYILSNTNKLSKDKNAPLGVTIERISYTQAQAEYAITESDVAMIRNNFTVDQMRSRFGNVDDSGSGVYIYHYASKANPSKIALGFNFASPVTLRAASIGDKTIVPLTAEISGMQAYESVSKLPEVVAFKKLSNGPTKRILLLEAHFI